MSRVSDGILRSKTFARSLLFLRRSGADVCENLRISYNILDRPSYPDLAVRPGLAMSHRLTSRRLPTTMLAAETQLRISAFRRRPKRLLAGGRGQVLHQHLGQLLQWLASSLAVLLAAGRRWRDDRKSQKQFISPALAQRLGCKGRQVWRFIPTQRKMIQYSPKISSRQRCHPVKGLSLHHTSSTHHRIAQVPGDHIRATHPRTFQKRKGVGGGNALGLAHFVALATIDDCAINVQKNQILPCPFTDRFFNLAMRSILSRAVLCSVDSCTGL